MRAHKAGEASATPGKLFDYSDRTTQATGELAAWVRGTLREYITAYQAGAVDFGNDIRGISGSHRGGDTIGIEVDSLLTRVYATDRSVRHTGHAFAAAGGGSARGDLGIARPTTGPVKTTDAALLAQEHSDDMAAGARLAAGLPGIDGDDPMSRLTAELAEHGHDPYFAAGFFNALTPAQLKTLLPIDEKTIPPLVSAYRSGALDQSVTDTLIHKIVSRIPKSVHAVDFLSDLAADPVASAHFADALDSAQIFGMLAPSRAPEGLPVALIKVLTSATRHAEDPEQITSWVSKLSSALLTIPDPRSGGAPTLKLHYTEAQLKAITPHLMAFARACQVHLLVPPPKADADPEKYGDALTRWADASGQNMVPLRMLGTWIELDYQDLAQREQDVAGTRFGLITSLVADGLFMLPELAAVGEVSEMLIQAGLGVATNDLQPIVASMWTEDGVGELDKELAGEINHDIRAGRLPPDEAMNEVLKRRANVLFALRAVASGTLVADDGKTLQVGDLRGPGGMAELAKLLNKPGWARAQRVKADRGRSLEELLKLLDGPMP